MVRFVYRGEPLTDRDGIPLPGAPSIEERNKWTEIVIAPGVIVIPRWTFKHCMNIVKLIMTHDVVMIEEGAVCYCYKLKFIKWSNRLEYIGTGAFSDCFSLVSVFLPASIREVRDWAFGECEELRMLIGVPSHARLGSLVISATKLIALSPFQTDYNGDYYSKNDAVNEWLTNQHDNHPLHRMCSSYNQVSIQDISNYFYEHGLMKNNLYRKDDAGLTAWDYLNANPNTNTDETTITEMDIVQYHVLRLLNLVLHEDDDNQGDNNNSNHEDDGSVDGISIPSVAKKQRVV